MPDESDDSDFLSTFWTTKHALAVAMAAAFARHGVYDGQQFILRSLWAVDGLTPGQVAKQVGIATSTVTRAATRMEAAGWLRREPHPDDRRLVRLRLTERGHDLEQAIEAETAGVTERALAGFDPARRAELIRVLREVHRNLTPPRPAESAG